MEIRHQIDQADCSDFVCCRMAEDILGDIGPSEYGFRANVNPNVRHPRWRWATEDCLGTAACDADASVQWLCGPGGYAEAVAVLYEKV